MEKKATSLAEIVSLSRELLNSNEAAAHIGVMPSTLAVWRCTKRYPIPYLKVGRLVKYRRTDLDAYLMSRTVGNHEPVAA